MAKNIKLSGRGIKFNSKVTIDEESSKKFNRDISKHIEIAAAVSTDLAVQRTYIFIEANIHKWMRETKFAEALLDSKKIQKLLFGNAFGKSSIVKGEVSNYNRVAEEYIAFLADSALDVFQYRMYPVGNTNKTHKRYSLVTYRVPRTVFNNEEVAKMYASRRKRVKLIQEAVDFSKKSQEEKEAGYGGKAPSRSFMEAYDRFINISTHPSGFSKKQVSHARKQVDNMKKKMNEVMQEWQQKVKPLEDMVKAMNEEANVYAKDVKFADLINEAEKVDKALTISINRTFATFIDKLKKKISKIDGETSKEISKKVINVFREELRKGNVFTAKPDNEVKNEEEAIKTKESLDMFDGFADELAAGQRFVADASSAGLSFSNDQVERIEQATEIFTITTTDEFDDYNQGDNSISGILQEQGYSDFSDEELEWIDSNYGKLGADSASDPNEFADNFIKDYDEYDLSQEEDLGGRYDEDGNEVEYNINAGDFSQSLVSREDIANLQSIDGTIVLKEKEEVSTHAAEAINDSLNDATKELSEFLNSSMGNALSAIYSSVKKLIDKDQTFGKSAALRLIEDNFSSFRTQIERILKVSRESSNGLKSENLDTILEATLEKELIEEIGNSNYATPFDIQLLSKTPDSASENIDDITKMHTALFSLSAGAGVPTLIEDKTTGTKRIAVTSIINIRDWSSTQIDAEVLAKDAQGQISEILKNEKGITKESARRMAELILEDTIIKTENDFKTGNSVIKFFNKQTENTTKATIDEKIKQATREFKALTSGKKRSEKSGSKKGGKEVIKAATDSAKEKIVIDKFKEAQGIAREKRAIKGEVALGIPLDFMEEIWNNNRERILQSTANVFQRVFPVVVEEARTSKVSTKSFSVKWEKISGKTSGNVNYSKELSRIAQKYLSNTENFAKKIVGTSEERAQGRRFGTVRQFEKLIEGVISKEYKVVSITSHRAGEGSSSRVEVTVENKNKKAGNFIIVFYSGASIGSAIIEAGYTDKTKAELKDKSVASALEELYNPSSKKFVGREEFRLITSQKTSNIAQGLSNLIDTLKKA